MTLTSQSNNVGARLLNARLLTWSAAALIYLIFALLSATLDEVIILPALGTIGALALLYTGSRYRQQHTPRGKPYPKPERAGAAPTRRMIVILIVLAAFTSLWQISLVPPELASDSLEYFAASQQILGRDNVYQSAADPGYLEVAIITYGYPTFLTLTRLIYDDMASLVIAQHLLRIAVTVAAYVILVRHDARLGRWVGLLLAASPMMANYAHFFMTEPLYLPLLLLLFLALYQAITAPPEKRTTWVYAIAVGLLCAVIPWVRPVGGYLFIPALLLLAVCSRSWRKTLLATSALAVGLLLISGGRYLIDRNFTYQTTTGEVYYTAFVLFHDLLDEDNGPASAHYVAALESDTCRYQDELAQVEATFDDATTQHQMDRLQASMIIIVMGCVSDYNERTGTSFPDLDVYVESIAAEPPHTLARMYDETAYFLTQMDTNIIGINQSIICEWGTDDVNMPGISQSLASFQDYACWNYPDEANTPYIIFQLYSVIHFILAQPYLFLNGFTMQYVLVFWAALLLIGFVVIEGAPRWRLPMLIALTIVAYHVAVVAVTFYTTARYVLVMTPFYVLIATMLYIILIPQLADSLYRLRRR